MALSHPLSGEIRLGLGPFTGSRPLVDIPGPAIPTVFASLAKVPLSRHTRYPKVFLLKTLN
ncbi:hypothetical protein ISN44_As13g025460 [Arabidopsis suecica]|uniref:Uncharacterized protein n=1 Tax=Arabidopsis suecica TaxID=45249 RepID=A0A8T1Y6X6_ARASU|nr:hypothetical protein ISN44_As13g025460 [Arabidopsis suecica]